MRDYLNSFNEIENQIEKINAIEDTSVELNLTANKLEQNIEPCLLEMKTALSRLQDLLNPCYQTLAEGKNICESKIKICDVDRLEIIEELGNLTGKSTRINKLQTIIKNEINIEIVVDSWREQYQQLKRKCFQWDKSNNKFKKENLNLFETDSFFTPSDKNITQLAIQLKKQLTEKLQLIFQEVNLFYSDIFTHCLDSLDLDYKSQWQEKSELIQNNLKKHFDSPTEYLPNKYSNDYKTTLSQKVILSNINKQASIAKKFKLNMNIKDLDNFHTEVENVTQNLIKDIISQKADIAIKAVEETINFYNQFLQSQNRYQSELDSQNKIEKDWIQTQETELDKIKEKISSILTEF